MRASELKARREALHLTQEALASYVGMNVWSIRNWEQGKRTMRTSTAILMNHALAMAESSQRGGFPLPDWRGLMATFGSQFT